MGRKIYLIGIGIGNKEGISIGAWELLQKSDVVIGAARMLEILPNTYAGKRYQSYLPAEIQEIVTKEKEAKNICVLLSGDVGFYSGAAKLRNQFGTDETVLVPGISSLQYFCAKLQIGWERICLVSMHGIKMEEHVNLVHRILHNKYTFLLLSGETDLLSLAEKLMQYEMNTVTFHIGQRLGYEDEEIESSSVIKVIPKQRNNLLVVMVENPDYQIEMQQEIEDDAFIRGNVPMTKAEVRDVVISKLGLTNKSVFYDIGAGTGSISMQAAALCPDCRIYAIEQKEEACLLIEQNKKKFCADFVSVINAKAPDGLEGLEVPTHAFIGGSSGNLECIIDYLYAKNPKIKIVISAVTLETQAMIVQILYKRQIDDAKIIQMSVASAKKLGAYHLMMAQNPIMLVII